MKLRRLLTVAEIKDQVLLGDDILRLDKEGPADIFNSETVVVFKGHRIPMHTVGEKKRLIQLVTVNTITIPGLSKKIIEGLLDRGSETPAAEECIIAETYASLQDEFKCVLAPTIVDVSGRASTYLRVLNHSPDTVTIPLM